MGAHVSLRFVVLLFLCGIGLGPARAQRKVFAHYMLANLDYVSSDAPDEEIIASYEREIGQAQAVGIDGFALNAGGWLREPRYIRRASAMFEAATRMKSGFTLFFSADMCCGNDAADIEDMMRRFANHPRYGATYFHTNGKAVLSTFAGERLGPDFWQNVRRDLEQGSHRSTSVAATALDTARGVPSNAPLRIFLVPSFFWGGELPDAIAIENHLPAYKSVIDGAFYWGIAGVPGLGHSPDPLASSHAYAAALHGAGKLYMAPICFQFWGANHGRYYEYSGYRGLRAMWMDAIAVTHAEWVEIITWNDFIEGTYVSPIDDPARYMHANDLDASVAPPSTTRFFHSHRGATELLSFFIEWYKTGQEPKIRRDVVYWAYGTQPLNTSASRGAPIQMYGPVAHVIHFTANLTAPATLRVSFGGKSEAIALSGGSTDVELPWTAGFIPHLELLREGSQLASADCEDMISVEARYPDLYYSTGFMHD